MLSAFLMTLALAISGNAFVLESRAITSNATCSSDFDWATNSREETPCIVAARILAQCSQTGGWNIPALNSKGEYTPPAGQNATLCSCSWATYNLLSACTACQGFEESGVVKWTAYKEGCAPGNLSNTGYPFAQLAFPLDTAIPFWAMQDPTKWPGERFDVPTAKKLDNQGQADTVGPPPKKHTSTVGPIVGGVIGGLAAIALALGAAFFLKSRKKKQHRQGAANNTYEPGHARNKSDMSQLSQISGPDINLPYMRIQSPQSFATTQFSHPPMSPGTTYHTRSGSVNSLSYYGSVNGSIAVNNSPPPVPQHQLSPPFTVQPTTNPENIIVPFTLQPLGSSQGEISRQGSNSNLTDRKRADGAIISPYDPPNAPPQALTSDEMPVASASRRLKLNPPAYSQNPGQEQHGSSSQMPSRSRQVHTKQGSADTQQSWDSGRSGSTVRPGGGGSISTIGDVIGQMGLGTHVAGGGGGPVMTGYSSNMGGIQSGPAAPLNTDNITRHNLA